ncbi:hypothetical protein [Jatrophihabitans sp.]|uniref:hypothetical protein n=1 Tax=Jatrophihabitans sp. TaxID=1932789 RepID=UPI0030C775B3|nr:uridine kinase [Jatrophihabitans sp.]
MTAPQPISPAGLVEALVTRVMALPRTLTVAVDGAPSTEPEVLASSLVSALRDLGRPAAHVYAETFWRDASIRLEYGREDIDAFLDWLDAPALRREVLDRLQRDGTYLPSLRDPRTNRATRAEPQPLVGGVVVISGALLLRHGLDFDLAVHLAASPAALARRTAAELLWTLPAFARYAAESRPANSADVVVRCDDPRHPAVLGLP